MRGASRASYGALRDALAESVADPAGAATLAAELFGVTALLDGEPGLRRALTDAGSPAGARSGLVRGLFGGRISRATLDLAVAGATARWSVPRDLGDALERLAVLASAAAADAAGRLDDLEDDLFRFGRIVADDAALHAALASPRAPETAKRELLARLLAGKAGPESLALITQAALRPRGRSLAAALADYARLAAAWRERLIALVRVAAEPAEPQRRRLAAALTALYGDGVYLNVLVDPELIGGMSVQIGDELIDGTLSGRLAALRQRLAA